MIDMFVVPARRQKSTLRLNRHHRSTDGTDDCRRAKEEIEWSEVAVGPIEDWLSTVSMRKRTGKRIREKPGPRLYVHVASRAERRHDTWCTVQLDITP